MDWITQFAQFTGEHHWQVYWGQFRPHALKCTYDFPPNEGLNIQTSDRGSIKFQKEMKGVSKGNISVRTYKQLWAIICATVETLRFLFFKETSHSSHHHIYVLSSEDFSDSHPSFLWLQSLSLKSLKSLASDISKHSGHKHYKSLPRYDTIHAHRAVEIGDNSLNLALSL